MDVPGSRPMKSSGRRSRRPGTGLSMKRRAAPEAGADDLSPMECSHRGRTGCPRATRPSCRGCRRWPQVQPAGPRRSTSAPSSSVTPCVISCPATSRETSGPEGGPVTVAVRHAEATVVPEGVVVVAAVVDGGVARASCRRRRCRCGRGRPCSSPRPRRCRTGRSTVAEARSAAVPPPQWLSASVNTVAGARLRQMPRTARSVLFWRHRCRCCRASGPSAVRRPGRVVAPPATVRSRDFPSPGGRLDAVLVSDLRVQSARPSARVGHKVVRAGPGRPRRSARPGSWP